MIKREQKKKTIESYKVITKRTNSINVKGHKRDKEWLHRFNMTKVCVKRTELRPKMTTER